MASVIAKKKAVLETSATTQVTILTLTEDDLGGGLTDDYAAGAHVTLVSRSVNDAYQGMSYGILYFARDSGAIEGLEWVFINDSGGPATIAVSDESPDIAIKITPPWTSQTIHRIWVQIFGMDDAYS